MSANRGGALALEPRPTFRWLCANALLGGLLATPVDAGRLAPMAAALADRGVDQVHFYVAPRLMGTGVAAIGDLAIARAADAVQLNGVQPRRLGADLLYTAEVQYVCSPDS